MRFWISCNPPRSTAQSQRRILLITAMLVTVGYCALSAHIRDTDVPAAVIGGTIGAMVAYVIGVLVGGS